MILLDTNAILWLETGDSRARPLLKRTSVFCISPASLLEIQFLLELGRIRLKNADCVSELAEDDRWKLDEPPTRSWFEESLSLSWTRDPFDRLIVAHALVKGFKLATGDAHIIKHLDKRRVFEL